MNDVAAAGWVRWALVGAGLLAGCSRSPPPGSDLFWETSEAQTPSTPSTTEPTVPITPSTPEPEPVWADSDRAVVLISLDGFRWDYVDRVPTPALDRIIAEGVRAEAMMPVFPSKTFPNHYTQVTGLYPSEHGIVGNSFFDDDLGAWFDMEETGTEWWLGEPIWVTASKQGLRTTTMFWPGSETPHDGYLPDEWQPYSSWLSNEDRVDQVLAWMDEPQPPHLATLYMSDVDHAGHTYGPDSAEVEAQVMAVDAVVGRLLDGLEARGKLDAVDLLVVSDHGMTQLSRDRAIFLDDHVDIDDFWIAAWGPYVTLDPKNNDATGVLEALADLPHASCSDDASRPPELHFPAGPRIPAILCLADIGWGLTSHAWFDQHPDDLTGATHGYHPVNTDMHGIFFARGPHLIAGATHPAFSSVHLYALLAELLQITPAPNAGELAVTQGMLVR